MSLQPDDSFVLDFTLDDLSNPGEAIDFTDIQPLFDDIASALSTVSQSRIKTSDSTAFGLSLLGAADDAAARSLLGVSSSAINWTVESKTASATLDTSDAGTLQSVDATSGSVTITLPSAASMAGLAPITIQKADNGPNTVEIDTAGAETINGQNGFTLSEQYQGIQVRSDGANWLIANEYDDEIDTSEIADSAITTAKVADGAITSTKLAAGVVSSQIDARIDNAPDWSSPSTSNAPSVAAVAAEVALRDMTLLANFKASNYANDQAQIGVDLSDEFSQLIIEIWGATNATTAAVSSFGFGIFNTVGTQGTIERQCSELVDWQANNLRGQLVVTGCKAGQVPIMRWETFAANDAVGAGVNDTLYRKGQYLGTHSSGTLHETAEVLDAPIDRVEFALSVGNIALNGNAQVNVWGIR